jgi:hypothetical protein
VKVSEENDTDYPLPSNWFSMGPEERDEWFKQYRAWRQAMAQDTAAAKREVQTRERLRRRAEARGTATLGNDDRYVEIEDIVDDEFGSDGEHGGGSA